MAVTQATLSPRVHGRADPSLVWLTVLFVTLGILLVFDTTYFRSKMYYDSGFQMLGKHLVSIVMGVTLLGVLARRRSSTIRLWARPVLALSVMLLLLTHVPGIKHCANGACRWVNLGPLNFQPAELVKLAFVAVVASHLCSVQKRVHEWRYGIVPVVALMGVLQVILVLQPDFGTVVLLGSLAVSMLLLAGVPLLAARPAGLRWWSRRCCGDLEPYRWSRVMCFLDPSQDPLGAGYQLLQAFRTFGSGGLTGHRARLLVAEVGLASRAAHRLHLRGDRRRERAGRRRCFVRAVRRCSPGAASASRTATASPSGSCSPPGSR